MNLQELSTSLMSLAEQVALDNNALSQQILAVADKLNTLVDDTSSSGAAHTWSIDKIIQHVTTAVNGALTPDQVAALLQVQQALNTDGDLFAHIINAMARQVSFNPLPAGSGISDEDKANARANIGAVGVAELEAATTVPGIDPVLLYRQIRGL